MLSSVSQCSHFVSHGGIQTVSVLQKSGIKTFYLPLSCSANRQSSIDLFFEKNGTYFSSAPVSVVSHRVAPKHAQVWACFSCRPGKSSIMNIAASSYAHIKPSWMQPVQVNRVCCETLKGVPGDARISIRVPVFLFYQRYIRNLNMFQERMSHKFSLKPFSIFISAASWVDLLYRSWEF